MRFNLKSKSDINFYIKSKKQDVKKLTEKVLQKTKMQLQILSPVRTGYLKSHYHIEGDWITNDASYIWYVNNGTIYQAGQHFIQQAIMIIKNELR